MMITKRFLRIVVLLNILMPLALCAQVGRELSPPNDVRIDPVTLVLSWNAPGEVILYEDFEEALFPPPDWQVISEGKGWHRPDTVLLNHWKIPVAFSKYAISNDDSSSTGNNGSADLLITPVIDLTANDSLVLTFDSYFDGAYGQSAYVEYSTNGGLSWAVVEIIKASLVWEKISIDLTGLSGIPGSEHINFAFHSDDNGLNGSGWAVDNIEIANSPVEDQPVNYIVFFDAVPADTTTELSSFIPTIEYTYGEEHNAGVCACYPGGNSDTVSVSFVSKYLFPLYDLYMDYCGQKCFGLGWSGPFRPPACWPWELETYFETPDNWTEGGCDAWNDHIYIVYENMNGILKMDKEGNVVDLLIIPGVPPLTDLTHDGWSGRFYGCNGTNNIYEMDFETQTLTDQFFAPVNAHALAYSEIYELFYANDISSDITSFNHNGTIYDSFPVGNYGNIHSLTFDNSDDDNDLYAISRDSTGALIVGYYAWQGVPSGFLLDVSNFVEGGQAGGVFIDYDGCSQDCVYLGGSIQNEVVFEYALGEEHCPGWTPPGLWGYYIYKDGTLFDSVEIWCDKYLWWTWYPEDTLPQSYDFEVSVKYDLEELFGMNDQIDFSQIAGPVKGAISYGYELDFKEEWFSQSFSYHKWDTTGGRWIINNTLGNPAASASFRGINGDGQYSAMLSSYLFKPATLEPCGIQLSFDLRVYDNTPSGNQHLLLELWDSGTRAWQPLKEYSNDTIWSGFYHEIIDITDKVRDRHCMIRYIAHGDDPSDIQFWVIDNIFIEHSCPPPINLQAEFNAEAWNISVNWDSPFPGKEQWIHWDDSLHHASVGLGTGPETWCDVAARWEPGMLEGFQGSRLEKIAFIPSDPETHYILKVWAGDSAEILLYEQAIANLEIGQWNIIELNNPVILDDHGELWIGYSFSTKGQSPVSLDAGPAAEGSGNLCRIGDGEWTTFRQINPGFTGNINIRGYIHLPEVPAGGYRLYKSVDSGPFQFLTELESTGYTDSEIEMNEMYCYKMKSICISSPDTLSSDFSAEDCVLAVSVEEEPAYYPGLQIFPNPSDGKVFFTAPEPILQVEVYDITGRSARSFNNFEADKMIDLSCLNPGVYLVIFRGKQTVFYNKVAVSR